jgi:hypothetical protein
MAAAQVKAPESLAENQMRQLDNQEGISHSFGMVIKLPVPRRGILRK